MSRNSSKFHQLLCHNLFLHIHQFNVEISRLRFFCRCKHNLNSRQLSAWNRKLLFYNCISALIFYLHL